MRKYNVKLNGKTYQVEVEEAGATLVGNGPIKPASSVVTESVAEMKTTPAKTSPGTRTASEPKKVSESKKAERVKEKSAAVSAEDSMEIKAGSTGKVFHMDVIIGQTVKNGDTIMVLEAMKMEIPIVCPKDGIIAELRAAVGDAVETGQILAILK